LTLREAQPPADGDREARIRAIVQPARTVPGWATVDLDRAAGAFEATAHGRGPSAVAALPSGAVPTAVEATSSELLGAICRLVRPRDASEVVLLEPSTEGRLAAGLARHGEGWLVSWLIVDPAAPGRAAEAGFRLSPEQPGPLGPERLLLGGPRDGPFVLLVRLDRR
jgi:hypothetical protein